MVKHFLSSQLNGQIGPYQVLSLRARMDQGAMAMKMYPTFPRAPGLERHHQIVLCHIKDTRWKWSVLTLCRNALGLFYSSPLAADWAAIIIIISY